MYRSLLIASALLIASTMVTAQVKYRAKGAGTTTIRYSAPTYEGSLVATGEEWAMGVGRPTTMGTDAALVWSEGIVFPGQYTLAARRDGDQDWSLVVREDTGQGNRNNRDRRGGHGARRGGNAGGGRGVRLGESACLCATPADDGADGEPSRPAAAPSLAHRTPGGLGPARPFGAGPPADACRCRTHGLREPVGEDRSGGNSNRVHGWPLPSNEVGEVL